MAIEDLASPGYFKHTRDTRYVVKNLEEMDGLTRALPRADRGA